VGTFIVDLILVEVAEVFVPLLPVSMVLPLLIQDDELEDEHSNNDPVDHAPIIPLLSIHE